MVADRSPSAFGRAKSTLQGGALTCVFLLAIGCSSHKSAATTSDARVIDRLTKADALLRAGCLDCLADAYQDYESLLSVPQAHERAMAGLFQAAMLGAIRERELGMEDSGNLRRALGATQSSPSSSTDRIFFDIVDTLTARGARESTNDVDLRRRLAGYKNRSSYLSYLGHRSDQDPLSAYLWVAFNCAYESSGPNEVADWMQAIPTWRDTPLIAFTVGICNSRRSVGLDRLLQADPRFVEINYPLAISEILAGDLEASIPRLQHAYAWHPRWPAATTTLAYAYLTDEDFEHAVEFFDRTLLMRPDAPDALLGKARALTYLAQPDQALATIDRLLALNGWLLGDARYWRSFNESQLGQYDRAWDDIEQAAKLLTNAEVPKLAGIIAYRRHELAVAGAKFRDSRRRNPDDCEAGFYFGLVLSEQNEWNSASGAFETTANCIEREQRELREAIARLRASPESSERQARRVKRQEQDLESDGRMLANTWFNTAVAYYMLARHDDARRFVEKVTGDAEFGERARNLLAKLK